MQTIYYNFARKYLCDASGAAVSELPEIVFSEKPTWRIVPVNDSGEICLPSGVTSFRAAVAFDFQSSTGVAARTLNDGISAGNSGIDVQLNTNTEEFLAEVDGQESRNAYFELTGLDADSNRIFYLSFRCLAHMILDPSLDSSLPEEVQSNFVDRETLTSMLSEKLTTPTGGTTGQVLKKTASGVEWANDETANLSSYYTASQTDTLLNAKLTTPTGGSTGQVLKKTASGIEWANDETANLSSYYTASQTDTLLSEKLTTPTGGTTGQVLKKTASGIEWANDETANLSSYYTASQTDTLLNAKLTTPTGGSTGQVLKKTASGVEWANDETANLSSYYTASQTDTLLNAKLSTPTGGTTGQVLKKTASGTEWANESDTPDAVIYTDTMPSASADSLGTVVVYTGSTSANYIQGHYYLGTVENSIYDWQDVTPVADVYTQSQVNGLLAAKANEADLQLLQTRVNLIGAAVVPVGTVIAFVGSVNSIPDGWLVCDGSQVSQTTYRDLYYAIGGIYEYGTADSGKFCLPDFRGKFLRGYLSGTTNAIGTEQGDAIRNFSGGFGTNGSYAAFTGVSGVFAFGSSGPVNAFSFGNTDHNDTSRTGYRNVNINLTNASYPVASEIRPVNYAVFYIIKY